MGNIINPGAIEAFRRECEARHWVHAGYTTKVKVDQLMTRIAARRGKRAAELLREDMRREYARNK